MIALSPPRLAARRPHIDWAGALAVPRAVRRRARRAAASACCAARVRARRRRAVAGARRARRRGRARRSGSGTRHKLIVAGRCARRPHARADVRSSAPAARRPCCCPGARAAAGEAGHGEYHALLLIRVPGMLVLVAAQNLVTLFLGFELLSIPLYVLCATEMRRAQLARVRPEVPDHRLGRLGHAALRPGALYGATGATDFAGIAAALGGLGLRRPAAAHRHRADRRRPGLQGLGRALPPVDARRLRGRADARSPRSWPSRRRRRRSACSLRLFDVALIGARRHWAPALAVLAASRSSSATSARSARPRSSGCSPTRRSRRPATCSPASSWSRRSSASRPRSSTSPSTSS